MTSRRGQDAAGQDPYQPGNDQQTFSGEDLRPSGHDPSELDPVGYGADELDPVGLDRAGYGPDELAAEEAGPDELAAEEAGPDELAAEEAEPDELAAEETGPAVVGEPAAGIVAAEVVAVGAAPAGAAGAAGDARHWSEIQAMFVDDPRGSVEQAAAVADAAVSELMEALKQRQAALLGRPDSAADGNSTEELRAALRDYRAFCQELAGLGRQLSAGAPAAG